MHSRCNGWLKSGLVGAVFAVSGCGNNPPPPAPVAAPDTNATNTVDTPSNPAAPPQDPVVPPTEPKVSMSDVQPTATPVTPPPSTTTQLPPATNPATTPPTQDLKVALFGGLTAPKPATWTWQPANRLSVICEYIVPGRDGLNQGRLTVFRVGGTPEQNILRWKTTQFRGPNQTAVEPKIDHLESDGMAITLAEFTGEFKGTGAVNFSPDHTLLAAIIPDAPGGQIILYFVGPNGTVEPYREAFMEMIHNLKKVEAEK